MLISNAFAQAASGAAQDPFGGLSQFAMPIVILIIFWFMLIRPQMKRAKEHKALLEGLQKNDEVVTNSGIVGKVAQIGDNYIHVEVAPNTQIVVQKQAIGAVLPKGTLKSI
ncbi:MAG TPA: preprotein translocase subunit YajC [Zoogloea sp.]|uniref:preprotein translocase subunit YajC n=1 Tax=Zoogloea sp. TaxID=49181 RepID=UPI001B784305|nr:preprotein translocase subunit YajC [Zoogloea sp.]MBP7395200.1 preprotein translocase subunit YajC [Zoogloea sp.]HOB47643.1 preprotein translocase subunit YajC [Zoogloea sp.]HQA11565.1 preprotein translocase subunit YajC [Zoogloea sp.]